MSVSYVGKRKLCMTMERIKAELATLSDDELKEILRFLSDLREQHERQKD